MVNKEEGRYLAGFMAELGKGAFCAIRHEDIIRSGTPDLSFTRLGMTRWLEFKHGTPDFESKGIQNRICCQLAEFGWCRYVIWQEDGTARQTLIAHPLAVRDYLRGGGLKVEASCSGFNHRWLVKYLLEL